MRRRLAVSRTELSAWPLGSPTTRLAGFPERRCILWQSHGSRLGGGCTPAAIGRLSRASFQARNRAQVGVDGRQIVIRHVLKRGPRHDLEEIAVDRGGKTGSAGR